MSGPPRSRSTLAAGCRARAPRKPAATRRPFLPVAQPIASATCVQGASCSAANCPCYGDLAHAREKGWDAMNGRDDVHTLGDDELMASLRALVVRSNEDEAEMIEHLAQVDERRLYLPEHTSLWDFCLRELNFSENV